MTTPAPVEDQARLLEDALVAVRQQTSLMRKCLETPGKLMDALKCWYVSANPAAGREPGGSGRAAAASSAPATADGR